VEGRATEAIDPLGRVTATRYDAEGRVLEVEVVVTTPPSSRRVVLRTLDEEGSPVALEDGASFALEIDYDAAGRRTREGGSGGLPPPSLPHGYRSLRNSSIVSPASRTIPPIV
jgi:YD repeat-containing protein